MPKKPPPTKPDQPPKPKGNPAWVKGVSGNPGGRPKFLAEVVEAARSHSLWAVTRLRELAESSDERVALAALRELLDRGIGRAPEMPDDEEKMLRMRLMEAKAKALETHSTPEGAITIVLPSIADETD